ncbi:MAG: aminotransferase class I/II-fold pyridoxal phosphate-dependent enzyme [Thaumarchaeota archaeon]|nr:aminotransferase class I/II-fold pyridoxal phosphate-dependent enzyme [Nitrososphaerota archaeon]
MTNYKKTHKGQYNKVFSLLRKHHKWFANSIPLIASENITSSAVREAFVSDLANRYAEGWPGERVYAGCNLAIDPIELTCIDLAKKLFKAEFVDVRPVSGVCANLAVYSAFTNPSDRLLALAIPSGGHISSGRKEFSGTAGLVHGLRTEYFAYDKDEMNIDVDKTKEKVKKMVEDEKDPPKMAMFGGSLFLFPHPIKELADFLKSYGIFVCYDSAHVSGLIAGNHFQDPLREGAEAVTLSTHKTLPGPQGGTILSFEKYAESIKKAVFPGNTSNHHLHSVAAKAVVFAEMIEFGKEYATQVVKNAKRLAQTLSDKGITILGEKKGFTKSHQIALDISKYGDGGTLEKELEKANIIANRQLLPGDIGAGRHYMHPSGLRFGTQEVTRFGMKQSEMEEIAELVARVIIKKENPLKVKKDVITIRKKFQKIHYAFDTRRNAYDYIRIR